MKRIGIVGLCFVAMVAFSAMAASAAYAGEYGECVKTKEVKKAYTGNYNDAACLEYVGNGTSEYEWYAVGSKELPGPIVETETTKTVTLESPLGSVVCKRSTSKAEITGAKTDIEEIAFTSCEAINEKANSYRVPAAGLPLEANKTREIQTFLLDTFLVGYPEELYNPITNATSGPQQGEVWTCFTSAQPTAEAKLYEESFGVPWAANTYLAQLEFSGIHIRVQGVVCGVATGTNVMGRKTTDTFSKTGGEQSLDTEYSLDHGVEWLNAGASVQIAVATAKTTTKMEIKS